MSQRQNNDARTSTSIQMRHLSASHLLTIKRQIQDVGAEGVRPQCTVSEDKS